MGFTRAWGNVLIKLLLLNTVKVGIVGSTGALIFMATAPLGLPIGNTWFDGFVVGYGVNVIIGSAVSSMVEPDEESSKAYVFLFRYGHAVFNRSTTYFTHKSMWRMFMATSKEDEVNRRS